MTCPQCGAVMIPWAAGPDWPASYTHRAVCEACGHSEPLPAAMEVAAAGTERLPGVED